MNPISDRNLLHKIAYHVRGMVDTFKQIGRTRSLISDAGQFNTVTQLAQGHSSSGLLVVGKDITVRQAKGISWFDNSAGLATRLFEWVSAWNREGHIPRNPFGPDPPQTQQPYRFVDFWSVILLHLDVLISCIFLCRIFFILKPRIICILSDKVFSLMEEDNFSISRQHLPIEFLEDPGIDDYSHLETYKRRLRNHHAEKKTTARKVISENIEEALNETLNLKHDNDFGLNGQSAKPNIKAKKDEDIDIDGGNAIDRDDGDGQDSEEDKDDRKDLTDDEVDDDNDDDDASDGKLLGTKLTLYIVILIMGFTRDCDRRG